MLAVGCVLAATRSKLFAVQIGVSIQRFLGSSQRAGGIQLEGRRLPPWPSAVGNVDADGCAKNSSAQREERVDAPPTGWKLVRPLWPSADCRGMPMATSGGGPGYAGMGPPQP